MKNFLQSKDAEEINSKQYKSLYESSKDHAKRLKALQGLYKFHEHTPNGLANFFKQNFTPIFEVCYLSIIKFHPSKFRLSSGYDDIKSLFSLIKQCVENLEKERIKKLIEDRGKEIYALFFHSLDSHTKKEIRLLSFNILIRIVDAFLTEKTNDIAKLIENKQDKSHQIDVGPKLPTELHEFFLNSIEFNLYNQKSSQGLNISTFQENARFLEEEILNEMRNGEWIKLIKENNAIAGVEEYILKEFFHFTKHENKIKNWFILLQQTWLKQIFETTKDKNKITPSKSYLSLSTSLEKESEESKKSIFVVLYKSNTLQDSLTKIFVQKVFLKEFKSYLKILSLSSNLNNYMNEENFKIFTKIISEFYYTEDCSVIVLKILRIYTKYFNSKGGKYTIPVIFESQATYHQIYIDLLNHIQTAILSEIDIIDKKCLNSDKAKLERPDLLNEIIKYTLEEDNVQDTLFRSILDISLNVLKKIDKPNINFNANFETLSPFLKNILLFAIKLEAFFTPPWKKIKEYFHKFLMNKDLMISFNTLILEETEKVIKFTYNEELTSVFQNIKINEIYKFRTEYTLQIFLNLHCKSHKCFEISPYLSFEPECSEFINTCNATEKQLNLFQIGTHKFTGWLHLIKLFVDVNHNEISPSFDALCDGIASVIEHLMLPEQYFPVERGKPVPRPKYNPPAQTLLSIFENFFRSSIGFPLMNNNNSQGNLPKKKGNLEYLLFSYKSLFKIICEAKSELPLPKATLVDFMKIVLEILTCEFDKLKDDDMKKSIIEICLIYTSKLFSNEFPGTKLLIPYYFDIIHHIFVISRKDFLYKKSHNENIMNILLRVTRLSDFKIYMDLLKNSCITLLKSIYGVINKYGNLSIQYKEKLVKLIEYKQNIVVFLQSVIFEFDENLQLKMKNHTPTMNKKYKHELMEDTLDFKNNFFSLVLYIMKDLDDIDVFKTIWQGILKIMGNDINNVDDYCFLCGDFLEANAFMGHDLIQNKDYKLFHSTMDSLLSVLNNSQNNLVKIKILNCLLAWIINDNTYQINLKPSIFDKLSITLKNLMKIDELREQVEVFYSHLIVNFYNFPPRNQTIDNNKSLFNEVSLHYDVIGFLSYFSKNNNPSETIYKKTIDDQTFFNLDYDNHKKFKILRKNISKSSPFPLDFKHMKKEKEHWNEQLPLNSNRYATLLNKIGIKKVAFDESHLDNRLSVKSIQEEIHKLNQKIGNSFPDIIEFDKISLFFDNNTIFSFLKGPKNTMKVIIRNISGKYAWVMKLFDAIGSDCIIKKYEDKGLEFKLYKNLIVQQESGQASRGARGRSGTQTHEFFEFKTLIRKPEKTIKVNKMLPSAKSAECIEKENDFSSTLQEIIHEIEDYNQFNHNHNVFFGENLVEMKKCMDNSLETGIEFEKKATLSYNKNSMQENNKNTKQISKKQNKSEFENTTTFLNGVKAFLIQNGFLTNESLKNIKILNDNKMNLDQYQNLINVLDQTSNRETIKIGIIYVGPHQEHQKEILMNQKGSIQYDWFLANLGKKIELDKHLGFLGGLKEINDGKYAIYYANSQVEIIYHVATYMPTIEGDDQQINKKRHVGNDHVTIIWSDNIYEYRKTTIASQYNCVVIVIYPLKNNLFKIQVFKKDHILQIYPWIDGAVFSQNELVPMIRLFSLNAHKKARSLINPKNDFVEFNSYLRRKSFIENIVSKFGVDLTSDLKSKKLYSLLHNKTKITPFKTNTGLP